jgi:hypothetical protein
LFACASLASASGGENATWRAGMTIRNNTDLTLQLMRFDGQQIDQWVGRPPEVIPPASESSRIEWLDTTPGKGTVGTVTYAVLKGSEQIGVVRYTLRIDCVAFCADYRRSTLGEVAPARSLDLRWSDNGGDPNRGYFGLLTVGRAPGGERYWRPCLLRKLPPEYANVVVHEVGCPAAKRAIRASDQDSGGAWTTPGWRCSSKEPGVSRTRVTCVDKGSRVRFDLD